LDFASGLFEYVEEDTDRTMRLCGIMGLNSSEWAIADFACVSCSVTVVPIYTTTPKETLVHLLQETSLSVIVCDKESLHVLLLAKPDAPGLKTLVVYGLASDVHVEEIFATCGRPSGVKCLRFETVAETGRKNPRPPGPSPTPDTIATFIFTSGSTGMPKGALCSHRALVASATGTTECLKAWDGVAIQRKGGEFHISYLPMAHIMERNVQMNVIALGGAIGFSQGKRDLLLDDIKTLRPTIFPSVPRLLNLIHDKILSAARAKGGIGLTLFKKGLRAKIKGLEHGHLRNGMWDSLVFDGIAKRVGLDRCKLILTGSAPIAGPVLNFLRAVFSCYVSEGYGCTETTGGVTTTHPHLLTNCENVGGPLVPAELRLVSVPEMKYLVSDTEHQGKPCRGRGEICVRGPILMSGYYRNAESTAAAVDAEGWYHTGDVGCILPNGMVRVFDRVRNIFKLSIGEYVQPEKVENIIIRSELVAQVFVHGDSFHSSLVAVVVPDPDAGAHLAEEVLKWKGDFDIVSACANDEFRDAILKDIAVVCKENGLPSYETPKKIFLEPSPFTPDNVLTATFKLQRAKAKEVYANVLESLLGEKN